MHRVGPSPVVAAVPLAVVAPSALAPAGSVYASATAAVKPASRRGAAHSDDEAEAFDLQRARGRLAEIQATLGRGRY